jgi:thioredoxin reductase
MSDQMNIDQGRYDVVVIGGGPAGLQAALTLGRMHRTVLLLDSGEYRNAPADHMHNFVTHDGRPPAEFRSAARADLAAYDTVTLCEATATWVKVEGDEDFRIELADGAIVGARRLVLATGVRDTLPDKPGLTDLFGSVAAHCPYCHGHEFSGKHVAVLGSAMHSAQVALLVSRIASRLTILADGGEPDDETAALLTRTGIAVDAREVTGFARAGEGAVVDFAEGGTLEIGGLFIATAWGQSAPFAEDLGLSLLPSGCVEVDAMGRTSLTGVYAAGDLAHLAALPMPLASVLNAAAAGLVAATALDRDLLMLDHALAPPA